MIGSDNFDIIFFEQYLKDKKQMKNSSVYQYTQVLAKFLKRFPDLTTTESYNNFLLDESTKKRNYHYYSVLKAFINFKIDDAILKKKLTDNLLRPRINRNIKAKRRYLTEEQIIDVINHLHDKRHRIIAIIQTLTGVRVSDVMRLKIGDILPDKYQSEPTLRLNIRGKGDKPYVAHILDPIAQDLVMNFITENPSKTGYYFMEYPKFMRTRKDFDEDEDALLRDNYHWIWTDLKTALNSCGILKQEFATHDYRRCFARRAWDKFKDVNVLKNLLNHADISTTMRYLEQSGMANIDYLKEMQR